MKAEVLVNYAGFKMGDVIEVYKSRRGPGYCIPGKDTGDNPYFCVDEIEILSDDLTPVTAPATATKRFKVGDEVIILRGHYYSGDNEFTEFNGRIGKIVDGYVDDSFDYCVDVGKSWNPEYSDDELELVKPASETAASPGPATGAVAAMRMFETGATRSNDVTKLDYEAALSPLVIERYLQYIGKHTIQADGTPRPSGPSSPYDNWQRGVPLNRWIKSAFRHFISFWKLHRGLTADIDIEESICAIIFNLQGYLHEYLKAKIKQETK